MKNIFDSNILTGLNDVYFMNQALDEARRAFCNDEVPIGAVIVDDRGIVIGSGYNTVELDHSQIFHAELTAIASAGKTINDWRLNNCWMYVTLEPCIMCIGAVRISRLKGIVFAADSPHFGFHLDKESWISLYNKDMFLIKSGICKVESEVLLKSFFEQKRKMHDTKKNKEK